LRSRFGFTFEVFDNSRWDHFDKAKTVSKALVILVLEDAAKNRFAFLDGAHRPAEVRLAAAYLALQDITQ
jgi:hypothetical protein